MSKKSIIALIIVIVSLFAIGVSVGGFLYTESIAQEVDRVQITGKTQTNASGIKKNVENTIITNDTDVNNIDEATIQRVETREKIVARDFWTWWKPMEVEIKSTEVGVKLPEIAVKKSVITPTGCDNLVYVGQDITYVIEVTNNSEIAVENIEISDKIPNNTTYVDNSIEDPLIIRKNDEESKSEVVGTKTTVLSENKVVGVKWIVSIPAGETVTAKFTVNVNKLMSNENGEQVETVGTISNTAIANGEESNEVQTSIIRTHKSSIVKRDGETVDSKTAKVGDQIIYTISIENTGDIDGTSYVSDKIPTGTKFISAQDGANITEAENEQMTLLWFVSVPAHTTITREFTVEVSNVEYPIKNIANVGGTPTNRDVIDTADIKVEKNATAVKRAGKNEYTTPVGEVKENDIIQYTIVVTNTGSKDLTNVLLKEQLINIEIIELEVDGIKKDIKYNPEKKLIIGNLKAAKEATEDTKAVDAGVAIIKAIYQVTYEADIKNKQNEDGVINSIYNKVIATGETVQTKEKVNDEDDETVPLTSNINIVANKTWNDNNNRNEKRPESVKLKLYKQIENGTKKQVGEEKVIGANGVWEYTWEELPKYENGKIINYTVEEESVTDYKATYSKSLDEKGNVTVDITNTYRQDITGQITTVQETELPLDVVFVLDISSSMLEVDANKTTSRVEDVVNATNTAIKELMKNEKNRVSVVLFNSNVYQITDQDIAKHYNPTKTGDYITYKKTTEDANVGGKISFSNGKEVNVATSNYVDGKTDGAIKCGTYTQGGVKKAAQIFEKSKDSTTARKPVMILLTDGDPTHYDTNTTYNGYGEKYPKGDGIARLRYINAEYYAYTMKTIENCKKSITGFYNNKECEIYTVGINMKGAMANTLLKPTNNNIAGLEDTTNISPDIHNHGDNGEQTDKSVVDSVKGWLSSDEYYKHQANRLKELLQQGDTKITSDYANKVYTNSTSDKISENFDDIINTITETKKINITADSYASDRIISLEGFNPGRVNINNIFSLKIIRYDEEENKETIIDTKDVNQTGTYIKGDSSNGYDLVLTNLTGKVEVELIYHK